MKDKILRTKIACYVGYIVQAIINNFLPILFIIFKEQYGLNYEQLGRLVFINFFVQIFADISSPFIVKRIGLKSSAVVSNGLAAFGLISLCFTPILIQNHFLAITLSVVIYAFGSGIIEVVISPIVEYLPTSNKSGNMAVLHSFYCWGQAATIIVTTLLVKVFGYGNWRFIPLVLAIIPFFNMINFFTVSVVERKEDSKKKKEDINIKRFIYLVIFMICSGASEIAMSQWASLFAQKGLNVNKFAGDMLGPCAFAILMGIGRIFYALMSKRISFLRITAVLSAMCLACYLLAGISKNPVIALLACAFCGLSVSMFWPGTLSFSIKTFPNGGTSMFGLFALSGDLGCSLGPWLVGIVADKTNNLPLGIISCSVFPILMFVTALLFMKENIEKN